MWDFWHGWDDLDSSLEEVPVEGVGGKEADPGRGVGRVRHAHSFERLCLSN